MPSADRRVTGEQPAPERKLANTGQPPLWLRNEPGVPVLSGVNWVGLKTLYIKEVRRFFKVQTQTVWAPAVTTLLYLVIFTVALGGGGRTVMGVAFADFLAPGLIVMAMLQNALRQFQSFSLLVGKMQGNIVDYLLPPLSTGELIAGLVGAAVTRAFLVGFAVWLAMLLWPGVSVEVREPLVAAVVRTDGLADARLPRADDLDLGRQVRPCGGGQQFRRHAVVAAVGDLLFGRAIVAGVPGGQPRQSVLLCDLGLPLRLPRRDRFAADGRRGRACCCSTSRCGRPATRCSRAAGKSRTEPFQGLNQLILLNGR